jgi:hypothetical protein
MTQKAQSVGLSRSKIREAGGIGGPIFGFLAISGTLNELPSGKRLQFANWTPWPFKNLVRCFTQQNSMVMFPRCLLTFTRG